MTVFQCNNRRDCTNIAFVVSLIVGIIAAFLQITGVITLAPIFSIVAFGIAIVYLAVLLLATALSEGCCRSLTSVLFGILGTILAAVILLVVTFAATSVIGAIVVGALFFFFTLLITSTACLVRCFANCND